MTTVEKHSKSETNLATEGKNHISYGCVSKCAFSYFIYICQEDPNLRLFAVNKLENALNSALSFGRGNLLASKCNCLSFRCDDLVRELLSCLSSDALLLRRSATHCLRLLSRVAIFANRSRPRLTKFVSALIRHGLSPSVAQEVKAMVCASFPQILTSDLFESYGLYDQVCDFEPLFRVLLELYSTEVGDKSSFKYAFVSLITIIGLEVYALIMKTWEQWNSINSFPSSYLQLSRKWSNDFFHSLKRSNYDYVQRQYLVGNGLSSTIRSQKKQLFSCSIRPSTTSLKQELSNGISFEDICPLLSRQAYEALIPLLHPAGGLVSTNCTPNTLTSHLAAEELRKSLTSELSSPDGWKMLFGNINDNGASDSSINLVRSSPGNRTRLLGALVKLLNQLAAHSNFNVVLCSLDIASMLVEALRIHTFCSFSMPSDSLENQASLAYYSLICDFFPLVKKALADSKLVVRAAGTKLALAMARPRSYAMLIIQEFIRPLLAQRTSCSRNVFECAEPNLHAVRLVLSTEDFLPQECVDLVTSLLLTLPSSEFDLPDICKGIIQVGLMNPKHSVQIATLDCVAVVAHLLGPGNLRPLLLAVSQAEAAIAASRASGVLNSTADSSNSSGSSDNHQSISILELVQNRLSKRQLPQLDDQCRVLRSVSNNSSSTTKSGSNREPTDHATLTDLESPSGISPRTATNILSPTCPLKMTSKIRRRPSAGLSRSRNQLPWVPRTGVSGSVTSSSGVSSAASPLGGESNASSASGARTVVIDAERTSNPFGFVTSVTRSPGSQSASNTQAWSTNRSRRNSRAGLAFDQDGIGGAGSQSVPSSGRISPVSLHSPRRNTPSLHGSRGHIPLAIGTSSNSSTPRGKPILAPLRQVPGRKSGKTRNDSSLHSPSVLPDYSSPLLPTRATIGRQSGRPWHASSSNSARESNTGRSHFGYGVSSPDEGSQSVSQRTARSTHELDGKNAQFQHDSPDGGADGESYDEDYEDDDEEEEIEDDDNGGNISSDSDGNTLHSGRRSGKANAASSRNEVQSSRSNTDLTLSSVRSAASHRRAMRLFEEAERQNRTEDSKSGANAVGAMEPLHVNISDSTLNLTPAVVPAHPAHRSVTNKASGKRRGTLTNLSIGFGLNQLTASCSAADLKSTSHASDGSNSGISPVPLPAKYNPYIGASFRENPDYSGLVIGRGAVNPMSQSVQLSSSPDLRKLPHYHQHTPSERKPLKGQHNIHTTLLSTSMTTTPSTDQATSPPTSSPSINVVGKGLFDSQQQSSPSPGSRGNRADSPFRAGRMTPSSLRSNGTSTPLGDGSISGQVNRANDGESETRVSHSIRQRVLQKKTKELQKLRKTSKQNSPLDLRSSEEEGGEEVICPKKINCVERSRESGLIKQSSASSDVDVDNDDDDEDVTFKNPGAGSYATLPPRRNHHNADAPLPKPKRSECQNMASGDASKMDNSTPFHRVQSTGCLVRETDRSPSPDPNDQSARSSSLQRTDPGKSRPLLKGRSTMNLTSVTNTLPFALERIASDDWESKVSGLETIAQLALEKPGAFTSASSQPSSASAGVSRPAIQGQSDVLHQVVQAIIAECKNLRSQVSRQAVQTLSGMFRGLGRAMDPHVEVCVRVLLGKTGEAAAAFIRDEVSVAMDELSQAASPSKIISALMQHGLGHKNAAVRLQTAVQITRVVESLASQGRLYQCNKAAAKDRSPAGGRGGFIGSTGNLNNPTGSTSNTAFISSLMERLVTALSQFLTDGNQDTRYHGRRLLYCLMQHPDFDRLVCKYLSGQSLKSIKDAMEHIEKKGVGEPPSFSAGARRPGFSPASGGTRGSSAGGGPLNN